MPLPEWLIERGIGESRAVLVENGKIVEARIMLAGVVPAGAVLETRLTQIGTNGRNAVATVDGVEYLLPKAPGGITQGAKVSIEVSRETIPGREPWKRPLAVVTDKTAGPAPALQGRELPFPSPRDELVDAGWPDLIEEARSGIVRFPDGELRVSVTPAMTLIDVDGQLPPFELARAGADAAARAIRRHGIGGSIGIDFPTVAGKAERQAIADGIDANLPQPFERTAVNGFGFLQIVRPRRHASLFEIAADRAPFEARALLRTTARETGAIRLVAHPAVTKVLAAQPAWLEALGRQVGGAVGLRADPSLPMSGGHVEKA
jgi:ribonuclease G